MIVCLCHRVTDRDIDNAARQGCASFEQLQEDLRVSSSCGACEGCAKECFSSASRANPRPAAALWPQEAARC